MLKFDEVKVQIALCLEHNYDMYTPCFQAQTIYAALSANSRTFNPHPEDLGDCFIKSWPYLAPRKGVVINFTVKEIYYNNNAVFWEARARHSSVRVCALREHIRPSADLDTDMTRLSRKNAEQKPGIFKFIRHCENNAYVVRKMPESRALQTSRNVFIDIKNERANLWNKRQH